MFRGHVSVQYVGSFDPAEHFDTVPELAGRAFNRPRKSTLETAQVRRKV